jgi:beta-galactosidase
MLGIAVEDVVPHAETESNAISTGEPQPRTFGCRLWSDVLRLEGAEAKATYTGDYYRGRPAITRYAFGQGVSFYLGTALDGAGLAWLLDMVCVEAGVRAYEDLPAEVEITRRTNGDQSWLFVLNGSAEDVDLPLDQPGLDLLTGTKHEHDLHLGPLDVAILQSTT